MVTMSIIILPHITMKSITPAQQQHILSLLDKGKSGQQISSLIGVHASTISRLRSKHCSTLSKSIGGRPSKLSPLTSIMLSVLSLLRRLKMLCKLPKHFKTLPINQFHQKL
jgi:transposase